jgi:hypothetical protein
LKATRPRRGPHLKAVGPDVAGACVDGGSQVIIREAPPVGRARARLLRALARLARGGVAGVDGAVHRPFFAPLAISAGLLFS